MISNELAGTAADPMLVRSIERAERENVLYAQLWRELVAEPREVEPRNREAEALRRTAQAAVMDWLEARS